MARFSVVDARGMPEGVRVTRYTSSIQMRTVRRVRVSSSSHGKIENISKIPALVSTPGETSTTEHGFTVNSAQRSGLRTMLRGQSSDWTDMKNSMRYQVDTVAPYRFLLIISMPR